MSTKNSGVMLAQNSLNYHLDHVLTDFSSFSRYSCPASSISSSSLAKASVTRKGIMTWVNNKDANHGLAVRNTFFFVVLKM